MLNPDITLTIDELVEKLLDARKTMGGKTKVVCWHGLSVSDDDCDVIGLYREPGVSFAKDNLRSSDDFVEDSGSLGEGEELEYEKVLVL